MNEFLHVANGHIQPGESSDADAVFCPSGHNMVWTSKVPYKSMFGGQRKQTTCTSCKCTIIAAFFFHNCIQCRIDYCHDCADSRKGKQMVQQ